MSRFGSRTEVRDQMAADGVGVGSLVGAERPGSAGGTSTSVPASSFETEPSEPVGRAGRSRSEIRKMREVMLTPDRHPLPRQPQGRPERWQVSSPLGAPVDVIRVDDTPLHSIPGRDVADSEGERRNR
jgi:hypothetical protein